MKTINEQIQAFGEMIISKGWDRFVTISPGVEHDDIRGKIIDSLTRYDAVKGWHEEQGAVKMTSYFSFTPVNLERTPLHDPIIELEWKKCHFKVQYSQEDGFTVKEQQITHGLEYSQDMFKPLTINIAGDNDILGPQQCWDLLMPWQKVNDINKELER